MIAVIIIIVILVVLGIIFAALYNSLVGRRNQVDNSWSQIDVQLKRRHDLIPNLVEAVKDYMSYEQETLTNVTAARAAAINAGSQGPQAQAQAENMLTESLKSLFAVVEAYPDLKANQNFLALQEELANTENKIGFARQFYNDAVKLYKNRVEMFPSNIVANIFGFKVEPFFEVESSGDRATPQVKF